MTYSDSLHYLDSLDNYEKRSDYDYESIGLAKITELCAILGDPQKFIKSIQVAGTKGKGSTSAIICSMLRAAGFKTGLYTSPHLVSFRERIRVDDVLISEPDTGRILDTIRGAIDRMKLGQPTFFEVCTALAYVYFKEKAVDFAVYEAGMGGRLDATSVIRPLVSVITPISYEHTDKLGGTLSKIAFEKGGIIKEGGICVSAPQEREAEDEIRKICRERKSRLVMVGRDIIYREVRANEEKEVFHVTGHAGSYPDLEMELLGAHQVVNAATAIGAIGILRAQGVAIPEEAIRRGISGARWEGRLEIAGRKPYLILDGAQNRASAAALSAAIGKIFKYRKLHLVLGVSRDKDIKGILDELVPLSDSIILTMANIPQRALEPARMKELIGCKKDVSMTSNVKDALDKARSVASPEDLILVTGSLFVVGEAKGILR